MSEMSEEMTQNLKAFRPFTAGEVVIDAIPLVHVISDLHRSSNCGHCLAESPSLKRCSNCHQIYYCDKKCQKNDWISHKNECKVFSHQRFKLKEVVNKERLLLRLWFAIKTDETFATKRHQLIGGSDVSLNDIEVKTKELSKNMDLMIEFHLIFNHFKSYGLEFERKELLHWFAVISTTPCIQAIDYYHNNEVLFYSMASGVYIQLSSLSHSCVPNCAVVSNGLRLQVRAMKSIAIGEELTISFIDLVQNRDKRQKQLKDNFIIECKCNKCVNNLDKDFNYNLNGLMAGIFETIWVLETMYDPDISIDFLVKSLFELIAYLNPIFGDFYPLITEILFRVFIVLKSVAKIDTKLDIHEVFDRLNTCIKVTHGLDHQLYKAYLRLTSHSQ